MTAKYYRNVVTVEFLSVETWGDEAGDLDVLNYEITEGSSIGYVTRTVTNQEITRDEAIESDVRMGGDGSFLTRLIGDEDEDEETRS